MNELKQQTDDKSDLQVTLLSSSVGAEEQIERELKRAASVDAGASGAIRLAGSLTGKWWQ